MSMHRDTAEKVGFEKWMEDITHRVNSLGKSLITLNKSIEELKNDVDLLKRESND